MMKRRYIHMRDDAYSSEVMGKIEQHAEAGWELVTVVPWSGGSGMTFYMKRPVEQAGEDSSREEKTGGSDGT